MKRDLARVGKAINCELEHERLKVMWIYLGT